MLDVDHVLQDDSADRDGKSIDMNVIGLLPQTRIEKEVHCVGGSLPPAHRHALTTTPHRMCLVS